MKILNYLKNKFFGHFANYLCDNVDFYRLMDIIGEYDRFLSFAADAQMDSYVISDEESISAYKSRNDNSCDVYYKNIHVHIESDSKSKVIRIFLKRDGDAWCLPKKGNSVDIANPTTLSTEIYIWYDVDVFGISRCMASRYVKGSWNRYVTRTLTEFVNSIEDMTTQARISKAYTKH